MLKNLYRMAKNYIKNILLLFLIVGGFPLFVLGQEQSAETFTLEQCIDFAMENSIVLKNAKLDERISRAQKTEIISFALPQINANANLNYFQSLPRFFATKQVAFGFSGLDASKESEFLPTLKSGDVVSSPNFFQLKSSGTVALNISQIILNGSFFVGLKAAENNIKLYNNTLNKVKEGVIEAVSKAFYSVLVNRERIELFDSNISRLDSLLRETKILNENGFVEAIDIDRIQVSLNNIVAERNNFIKLHELTLEVLKFQINYPMDKQLKIDGELTKESVLVELDNYLTDWNKKLRPDYQLLTIGIKLQNLSLTNKLVSYAPTLSFNANLGYSTQSNTISGLFRTESKFTDTRFGSDKWYPVNSFGLSLSVPLFAGFQRGAQYQQEKLKLAKLKNNELQLESAIDLEVKQSIISYQNATETMEVQQRNLDLAKKVARVTKVKYQQGVGSNIEVVQAETSLRESQVNYYNALYDGIIAKINLDKAFGRLVNIK